MSLVIGIDDAGRGPVLGPMVLAGVLAGVDDQRRLVSLGVRDSKALTSSRRRLIGDKLLSDFVYHVEVSSPLEIDESDNLNYLEAVKSAMVVNKLMEKTGSGDRVKVVIDCPSVNIDQWCGDVSSLIKEEFRSRISLFCEHKADVNNVVAAAGSVLAKERREQEMFLLKKKINVDVGSGYPSDPKTVSFIKEHYDNPKYKEYIRHSWKTVKNLVRDKKQSTLF